MNIRRLVLLSVVGLVARNHTETDALNYIEISSSPFVQQGRPLRFNYSIRQRY